MSDFGRQAILDLQKVVAIYKYFIFLQQKKNSEADAQSFCTDLLSSVGNKLEYDCKDTRVHSIIDIFMEVNNDAEKLKSILCEQCIENFFSVLEWYLIKSYEFLLRNDKNWFSEIKRDANKQLSYQEIDLDKTGLDLVIEKETAGFGYKSINEKLKSLLKRLKSENLDYDKQMLNNFNKTRQAIVHERDKVQVKENQLIEYYVFSHKLVIKIDEQISTIFDLK